MGGHRHGQGEGDRSRPERPGPPQQAPVRAARLHRRLRQLGQLDRPRVPRHQPRSDPGRARGAGRRAGHPAARRGPVRWRRLDSPGGPAGRGGRLRQRPQPRRRAAQQGRPRIHPQVRPAPRRRGPQVGRVDQAARPRRNWPSSIPRTPTARRPSPISGRGPSSAKAPAAARKSRSSARLLACQEGENSVALRLDCRRRTETPKSSTSRSGDQVASIQVEHTRWHGGTWLGHVPVLRLHDACGDRARTNCKRHDGAERDDARLFAVVSDQAEQGVLIVCRSPNRTDATLKCDEMTKRASRTRNESCQLPDETRLRPYRSIRGLMRDANTGLRSWGISTLERQALALATLAELD